MYRAASAVALRTLPLVSLSSPCSSSKNAASVVASSSPSSLAKPRQKTSAKKKTAAKSLDLTFKVVLERSRLCDVAKLDQDADAFLKVAAARHARLENDKPGLVDWDGAMQAVKVAEDHFPIKYYEEDELAELQQRGITFNLAKVVNGTFTLKKLVDLGVDISQWESRESEMSAALTLDFDRDIAPKALLLLGDLGLQPATVAHMFTDSIELLQQDVSELRSRIDYLHSKRFSRSDIQRIVSEDPTWLTFPTEEIDGRLGYFQKLFRLSGTQVRRLATRLPELITWAGVPGQIRLNEFSLKETCGFSEAERKQMLLLWPELYRTENEHKLQRMFGLLHNEVGFSHELLAKFPQCLTEDRLPNEPRHLFLRKLGRDQYDPLLPNYVSPTALVLSTDLEFCQNVAKQPIQVFNEFLKTV